MVLLKNQQEIKFDYQYKKLLVHPTKPLLFFYIPYLCSIYVVSIETWKKIDEYNLEQIGKICDITLDPSGEYFIISHGFIGFSIYQKAKKIKTVTKHAARSVSFGGGHLFAQSSLSDGIHIYK